MITSTPIGVWEMKLPALLGNYNRPTNQPTDQLTDRQTDKPGHGEVSLQIIELMIIMNKVHKTWLC